MCTARVSRYNTIVFFLLPYRYIYVSTPTVDNISTMANLYKDINFYGISNDSIETFKDRHQWSAAISEKG